MDLINTFFHSVLINPIVTILVAIYQLLLSLHVPSALGFAIILLTVIIRLILYPLMAQQLKASKKMQELQPHLNNLKEKHKGDSKKLQEAQMALYKEHGVNPAAGCLPILIQFPLLIALYQVLNEVVKSPQEALTFVNKSIYIESLKLHNIWDTHFFGLPLGQHPNQLFATMPLIIIIPLITAALQFVQSKMMVSATPPASAALVPASEKKKKAKEAPKKEDSASEFAQAFQAQSLYIFPIMLGYLSFSFPVGLSLYWNAFSIFGILQQYQISGWGGLTSLFPKKNPK